ncbi:MAG: HigA family addiction module antitoxin [Terracidiphilus sp.]|jgi:addiction module HigA family antidote
MQKIPFGYSIHPGEILKTEFMEPLDLSSYRLAKDLHVSAPRINDIVLGKRGIAADTAMRLGAYFNTSAHLWLGLQMDHDLWLAAKNKSLAKVKPRAQAA